MNSLVVLSDRDLDTKFTYSVSDASFSIEQSGNSFTIKSATILDRETKEVYALNVIVSDGVKSLTLPITVTVEDKNDNAPVYKGSIHM